MATYIVKYKYIQVRTIILEASSDENAKLIGRIEGLEAGNIIEHDITTSDEYEVTELDEINFKSV